MTSLILGLALGLTEVHAAAPCDGRTAEVCAQRAVVRMGVPLVACLGGDARACSAASTLLRFIPEPEHERARVAIERACELGSPHACARAPSVGSALRADYSASLSVTITPDGFMVRPSGYGGPEAVHQLGCLSGGTCTGPEDYDLMALSEVTRAALWSAGPGTPSMVLITRGELPLSFTLSVIDALKHHPDGDALFPIVNLLGGM